MWLAIVVFVVVSFAVLVGIDQLLAVRKRRRLARLSEAQRRRAAMAESHDGVPFTSGGVIAMHARGAGGLGGGGMPGGTI